MKERIIFLLEHANERELDLVLRFVTGLMRGAEQQPICKDNPNTKKGRG